MVIAAAVLCLGLLEPRASASGVFSSVLRVRPRFLMGAALSRKKHDSHEPLAGRFDSLFRGIAHFGLERPLRRLLE